MKTNVKISKRYISTQLLASVIAMAFAVALPQLFHLAGKHAAVGTSLGEIFLPMHLPIIAVGLIAGPIAGALAGFTAPFISALLTGMPLPLMLPIIAVELCAYGAMAGYLKNKELPCVLKVFIVQLFGRILRGAFIAVLVYAFDYGVSAKIIYSSTITGIIGIILQLAVIPSIIFAVDKAKKNEQ